MESALAHSRRRFTVQDVSQESRRPALAHGCRKRQIDGRLRRSFERAGSRSAPHGEKWRSCQVHRPSTSAQVETNLRRHVYPFLGDRPIGSIRTSEIQSWVQGRSEVLSAGTVELVYRYVVAVFRAAVADRIIAASPAVAIKRPKPEVVEIEPLATEIVEALVANISERYRALVILAAGTGLRQGECFGLTVDRVDFLRRQLRVDRQLLLMPRQEPTLAPPKTKASYRTVPLPQVVLDALAIHLAKFPPGAEGFIFTDEDGRPYPTDELLQDLAAGCGESGSASRDRIPCPAALLRQSPDPPQRVRQDRPGPARPCNRGRDPGHVLASVARLRGSH